MTRQSTQEELRNARVEAEVAVRFEHRLFFTTDAFSPAHPTLDDVIRLEGNLPARTVFVMDGWFAEHSPEVARSVKRWVDAHRESTRLVAPLHFIPRGEACKNDPAILQSVLELVERAELCRQSYVVAIGGGAALDVVGYAAAIAHRGIRLIRFPTTTLSQCDSGVGVKNGVNYREKKNWLGAFSVPWAVINDEQLLRSLSDRDWIAGFSEAVKVALLKDAALYDRLRSSTAAIRLRERGASIPILRRSAELHFAHIVGGGDPFEMTTARPLDFGHWSAHKLEQMTGFRMRHGEAVAIGIALDTVYAAMCGLTDWSVVFSVAGCLDALGFELYHEAMDDTERLLDGVEEFRQHLGGQLSVTLIEEAGRPVEVHEIDEHRMRQAVRWLADRSRQPAHALRAVE